MERMAIGIMIPIFSVFQVRYPVLLTAQRLRDAMELFRSDASSAGISLGSAVSLLDSAEALHALKTLDSSTFFPHGYLVVAWYPFEATPENYELIMTDIKPKVFVSLIEQGEVRALSFLCFKQHSHGIGIFIDFYGQVTGNIKSHIAKAFQYTYQNMVDNNTNFYVNIYLCDHKESESQDIMNFLHNKLSLSYFKGLAHGNQMVVSVKWESLQSKM